MSDAERLDICVCARAREREEGRDLVPISPICFSLVVFFLEDYIFWVHLISIGSYRIFFEKVK